MIKNKQEEISFSLYDEEKNKKDDYVGMRKIKMEVLLEKDVVDKFFIIRYNKENAGTLRIRATMMSH